MADQTRFRLRRPRPRWKVRTRNLVLGATLILGTGLALAQDAHGSAPASYEMVTVRPGDTIWGIAAVHYPGSNLQDKVGEIETANRLQGPALEVGQELRVPVA
ncbi:MAG TPA: LysM peptidoglycan-binding domain-containing protein [Candidatus Nitrosotalea sp.]|nr:LysM peptidoglycan-binding domain-containing protein [Candidatus Nitrosotalea sp.]